MTVVFVTLSEEHKENVKTTGSKGQYLELTKGDKEKHGNVSLFLWRNSPKRARAA
jgi:hypothetical protein